MTIIMILHIRSKYTAVGKYCLKITVYTCWRKLDNQLLYIGRKEIVLFFYIYAVIELLAIFLDSAVIPTASGVYPVRLQTSPRPYGEVWR